MADEQYKVEAEIELRDRAAHAATKRLSGQLSSLGGRLRGADTAASKLTRRLLAIGGAYVGVSAVSHAFTGMVRGAFQFETSMQQTQLGLQSMVKSIEGVSFAAAGRQVKDIWGRLTDISIKTTATTRQINEIFSGIYGPIRAAGGGMEQVYEMTSNSVHAANALGVDLEQATRDMMMMASGAAGMDVKLYRMMKTSGFIKENTEEWNALVPQERVEKLAAALEQFEGSGDAAARTLGGRVSTFEDTYEQLRRAFFAPIFGSLADRLGVLNNYLEKNSDELMSYLTNLGYRVAGRLEYMMDSMKAAIMWVTQNWDTITARISNAVGRLRELAPKLAKGAALYAAAGPAFNVGGMALQGVGGMASLASMFAGGGAAAATAAGGAGAAAAGTAAAGGTAAGTAGAAGAAAGTAGLAAAAAPLLAVAGILGSIGAAVHDQWEPLQRFFSAMSPRMERVSAKFWELGKALGGIVYDAARTLGNVALTLLVPAFESLLWAFDKTLPILTFVAEKVGAVFKGIADVVSWVAEKVISMRAALGLGGGKTLEWSGEKKYETIRGDRFGEYTMMPAAKPVEGAKGRPKMTINQDFRGSKFSIKQSFKDSEPDRILSIFRNDLAKQAERRIQSGFAPAFTR